MSTDTAPAETSAIDIQHPWLGLASFTEETRPYFYGRDEEVGELARRVQRKLLRKRGFNRFAHFHALGVNLHRRESSNQLGFHPFIAAF